MLAGRRQHTELGRWLWSHPPSSLLPSSLKAAVEKQRQCTALIVKSTTFNFKKCSSGDKKKNTLKIQSLQSGRV